MRLAGACVAAVLLFLPAWGWAQEGHAWRGRFAVTMELTEEFAKLVAKQAPDGEELDIDAFSIEPVSGLIYLSQEAVRLDLNLPGSVMSTLMRPHEDRMYFVDHAARIAWEVDLAVYTRQYAEMGLPLLNPEEVFLHWEDVLAQMRALPGLTSKDLGAKTVNGVRCRGLGFNGRIEDVLKWGEVEILPELKPFTDFTGPWTGEYWIAEDSGLPVKMHSRMFGVDWNWEISQMEAWDASAVMFEVPRGYTIKPLDLPTADA